MHVETPSAENVFVGQETGAADWDAQLFPASHIEHEACPEVLY